MVSDAMQGESDAEFIERAMRRWIGLVAARDIDGLEAFLEEFYEPNAWVDLGSGTPGGEGVGVIIEWARDAFRDWSEGDVEFRYELLEVEDTGGGVIAPARG